MHWGKGVVVAFGVFVLGVAIMVTIAMTRKVDLVTEGYYEKGLQYQDQIERLNTTRRLGDSVNVVVQPDGVMLHFPPDCLAPGMKGEVQLYRPSDRGEDFALPIGLDSTLQMLIPRGRLASGLWRVKVQWTSSRGDFYAEARVVIQ
jgi:nitrogen fixation protein FixH